MLLLLACATCTEFQFAFGGCSGTADTVCWDISPAINCVPSAVPYSSTGDVITILASQFQSMYQDGVREFVMNLSTSSVSMEVNVTLILTSITRYHEMLVLGEFVAPDWSEYLVEASEILHFSIQDEGPLTYFFVYATEYITSISHVAASGTVIDIMIYGGNFMQTNDLTVILSIPDNNYAVVSVGYIVVVMARNFLVFSITTTRFTFTHL